MTFRKQQWLWGKSEDLWRNLLEKDSKDILQLKNKLVKINKQNLKINK